MAKPTKERDVAGRDGVTMPRPTRLPALRRVAARSRRPFMGLALLAAVVALLGFWPASAAADGDGLARQPRLVSPHGDAGYLPPPLIVPRGADDAATQPVAPGLRTSSTLPASHDLRTIGKLNAIRHQGAHGTCWAFAALASLESGLLPTQPFDFAEDHLVLRSGYGYADPYRRGGNDLIATAYLARWAGPVREQDDPYGDGYSPAGLKAVKHVQEVRWLPSATGTHNAALKRALLEHGAVSASIHWDEAFYESSNAAFYVPDEIGGRANHAVAIVGWDDAYPSDRFRERPPQDGAWIVRNSWGSGWGAGGYFHVSYYDALIGQEPFAYVRAEPPTNYDHSYQHDDLGLTTDYGYAETSAWFAARFTASSDEVLAAASFYAMAPGTQYEIWAGTELTEPDLSRMSRLAAGQVEQGGYVTVALPGGPALEAGSSFVVAVKATTPDHTHPVPLEMRLPGYSEAVTGGRGQSYVSRAGSVWTDLDDTDMVADVCLKAFTNDAPTVTAPGPFLVTLGLSSSQVEAGQTVTYAGRVTTDGGTPAGGQVTIERRAAPDGAWSDWRRVTLLGGAYSVGVRMTNAPRHWQLRTRMDGTAAGSTDHSPIRDLRVTVAPALLRTRALRSFAVRRGRAASFRFRVDYVPPAGKTSTYARARVILRVRDARGRSRYTKVFPRALLNRTLTHRIPRCWLKKGTYRYFVYATLPDGTTQQHVGRARFVVR